MEVKRIIMENIFHDDEFYRELEDLLEELELDKESIEELPEDYELWIEESVLQPLVTFDPHYIIERIGDERFSENNVDDEYDKISNALKKHVDFEALNAAIPKLYYPTRKKHKFTKKDLLEYIS